MGNKDRIFIHEDKMVHDAIVQINENGYQSVLVVDSERHLKGMITDGDIRRWILKGHSLDEHLEGIMNSNPKCVFEGYSKKEATQMMAENVLHILPVLDNRRRVIDVIHYVELLKKERHDTPVIIMAGGLGSRLKEKTKDCPKPLLRIGKKPILQTIIEEFVEQGFYDFYITVNYKSELVEEYFSDGKELGVSITYIREKERMGTAGALSLLPENISFPIIVINGDILTKTNFARMMKCYRDNETVATIGAREYIEEIPYGVISVDDEDNIVDITEKPQNSYLVSAGFYILGKEAVDRIPAKSYFDMPDLLQKLVEDNNKVNIYKVDDYWIDIGRLEDFNKAEIDYNTFF